MAKERQFRQHSGQKELFFSHIYIRDEGIKVNKMVIHQQIKIIVPNWAWLHVQQHVLNKWNHVERVREIHSK